MRSRFEVPALERCSPAQIAEALKSRPGWSHELVHTGHAARRISCSRTGYSPQAANASLKARSPGEPFSIAMMARRWLTYTSGTSNHERSFKSCRLCDRSASTFDRPTRKKPSVTLTARPASGVPRACSLDFIKMPGTLLTPPPEKSAGSTKVSSAVWLAGSDESVLRRKDIVILNLRSGISMSARTATSPFWLPVALICSVRQITEPIYCLPLGSDGSSSYSTTRCATGATWSVDDGCPTRSGIFGLVAGVPESLGTSTTFGCDLNKPAKLPTTDLPHRMEAPTRIRTMPTAIALLNGKTIPLRPFSFGSRPRSCDRRGRCAGGGA